MKKNVSVLLMMISLLPLFANKGFVSDFGIEHNVTNFFSTKVQIRTDDVTKAYISVAGLYKLTKDDRYSSILISKSALEGYRYLTIKANKKNATRVHILKEEPKDNNQNVSYSDYFKESILVRKGMILDVVIPEDVMCVYILNSAEGRNNRPDSITLYTRDELNLSQIEDKMKNTQQKIEYVCHKFLHWNMGNFSNGQFPFSTITEDNYKVKKSGFKNFIKLYGHGCHLLLNEYNETFSKIDGIPVQTDSLLFDGVKLLKNFPRSTSSGYNSLAACWNDGLLSYEYDVFNSLKGVKNKNGTLEYGAGYCLSKYSIGKTVFYVMSLHAPNEISKMENDALYTEILSICSDYENCILVGDFNRTIPANFKVLTDAGFTILNDSSVTYPSKGYILDWVLYKCKDVTLSDFKVYKEAVDSKGDLLSDHLPLSFKVTHK